MLILSRSDVLRLLPLDECMPLMADVFRMISFGGAVMPLRSVVRLQGQGRLLATMPVEVIEKTIGLKVITAMSENPSRGHEAHQALVLLFDPLHATPVALVDGGSITSLRTAAASAVATRLLARPDASTLAILGTGVQARAHLNAMCLVRRFTNVRVYGPNEERRRAFVAASQETGTSVVAASSAEEAVRGADVICTVTSAKTPILRRAWLEDGVHVNAVGACLRAHRELDTETIKEARVFVDSRESAANEAGDLLIPAEEGAIGRDHVVAELGEVLGERAKGRGARSEITVFKSLGLAAQDAVAANHVYVRAKTSHVGVEVSMA